jgi:hypothetical protein
MVPTFFIPVLQTSRPIFQCVFHFSVLQQLYPNLIRVLPIIPLFSIPAFQTGTSRVFVHLFSSFIFPSILVISVIPMFYIPSFSKQVLKEYYPTELLSKNGENAWMMSLPYIRVMCSTFKSSCEK